MFLLNEESKEETCPFLNIRLCYILLLFNLFSCFVFCFKLKKNKDEIAF